MMRISCLLWFIALLLTGCGNISQLQKEAISQIREHETIVRPQTHWSLHGRIAFKHAGDGGSGRIDWQQHEDALNIDLSAPMTRQQLGIRARLGQSICIDGLEDGPICDRDAAQLLVDMFGEAIPLHMLHQWVRGLPAHNVQAPRVLHYDSLGRPKTLGQAGWLVDYQSWHQATDTRPQLPRRIEISKGNTRLRLVIDRWNWGADAST